MLFYYGLKSTWVVFLESSDLPISIILISLDLICFKLIQVDTTKWIIIDFVVWKNTFLFIMDHVQWSLANDWRRLSSSLPPLPRPIMLKYEGVSEQSGSSEFFLMCVTHNQQLSSCLDLAKQFARSKRIFLASPIQPFNQAALF